MWDYFLTCHSDFLESPLIAHSDNNNNIVWHITPRKIRHLRLYTPVFVQIKQTRLNCVNKQDVEMLVGGFYFPRTGPDLLFPPVFMLR